MKKANEELKKRLSRQVVIDKMEISCYMKHYFIVERYKKTGEELEWKYAGDKLLREAKDSDVDCRTENKILEDNKELFPDGFTMEDVKRMQDHYERIHEGIMKHLKETGNLLNMKDLDVEKNK